MFSRRPGLSVDPYWGIQQATILTFVSGIVFPRMWFKQIISRCQLKCLGYNRWHAKRFRDWVQASNIFWYKRPTFYEDLNQTRVSFKGSTPGYFSSSQKFKEASETFLNISEEAAVCGPSRNTPGTRAVWPRACPQPAGWPGPGPRMLPPSWRKTFVP